MLTSVKAAENRADSLISWAFHTVTLLRTTPFHTSKGVCGGNNEEMVYDFPCGHLMLLHYLMSSYGSLDDGPGFTVHYLPSAQQSIKKDPPLMGLNYRQDGYCTVEY